MRLRTAAALFLVAAVLGGCSPSGDTGPSEPETPTEAATEPEPTEGPTDGPEPPAEPPESDFAVTSTDFDDGGELADRFTAEAFGGQCQGENTNPHLAWSGAPEGTESFLLIMSDISAAQYLHWIHGDIPADVTEIPTGASADLVGVAGSNQQGTLGYFGPCPPRPDHNYEFTVYALDAVLDLEEGFRRVDVLAALAQHTLAEATITGVRSGPAG